MEKGISTTLYNYFAHRLEQERNRLLDEAIKLHDDSISGQYKEMRDQMDHANFEEERFKFIRLKSRERIFMLKIETALERLRQGLYFLCEECGEEIEMKRLEARPTTTLCIECKLMQEEYEQQVKAPTHTILNVI